jgi:uncharacterized protein YecE (DUF72 family)
MSEILIGCSGWSYPEPSEKGGWTGAFYPDSKTKRLPYYSEFFGTAEIQLPPSFTVEEFSNTEQFLDRLPKGYDYALEFRHPSWETEGPWEMLKHYNIATVLIDSPAKDNLQFLSEVVVTANHSFIRWHGRDLHHRYNYLYSEEELKPWVGKIKSMQMETSVVRGYFNNHYGAKAVVNGLQFKEMIGESVSGKQMSKLEHAQTHVTQHNSKITSFTNSK